MRFICGLFATAIVLLSASCAAATTSSGLLQALEPARSLGSTAECSAPCKTEWERAQFWLARHSAAKTRIATDVRIETEVLESITGFDAIYSFVALREPLDGDRYRITLTPICRGGMTGCSPRPADVVSAFVYYVKTGQDVLVGRDDGSLRRVSSP